MIAFPPAKINLGLSVIRKRPDGYHDLETVMVPVAMQDILEIVPAIGRSTSLNISGIPVPGEKEENLVLKAYRLLSADYDLPPVQIHLHKVIPSGAGVGGGSSDAAHMIRLLNTMFDLNLTADQLANYGSRIGSDCPFFITGKPVLATGRGDVLEPVNIRLESIQVVLVFPPVHIPTGRAYSWVKPVEGSGNQSRIISQPVDTWKDFLQNAFEEEVFIRFPEIRKIKERLYSMGALYSSLSGSGAAVYGLFDHIPDTVGKFEGCLTWRGEFGNILP